MTEQPTPVRLLLSFPGSRTYAHDTVLPADWYEDSRFDGLKDYALHQLLPEAQVAAGLSLRLEFPDGATGVTADAIGLEQGLPTDD
ncbi:hypothetical protein ACWEDZ_32280 [Streptomyces sp. NPDC005047]